MIKLLIIFALPLCILSTAIGQEQIDIPHLSMNPDYPLTNIELDSVIRLSYSSQNDSLPLHKWEYSYDYIRNIKQSTKHSWILNSKKWSIASDMYEYSYNEEGIKILLAHYDWKYPSGFWRGCDSRGCGKKVWAFDTSGQQTSWTQSYWDSDNKDWSINDHWEKNFQYDFLGNMVLKSTKKFQRNVWGDGYWQGEKNEYSYDTVGNQMGHISYSWDDGLKKDWLFKTRSELEYTSSGNLSAESYYLWYPGGIGGGPGGATEALQWIGQGKIKWKYVTDDKIASAIQFRWDSSMIWRPVGDQVLYEYNDDGQPLRELVFRNAGGGPGPAVKQPVIKENEYSDKGELIREAIQTWNDSRNRWEFDYALDYAYDSIGRMVMSSSFNWKNEYTHDEYGNKICETYFQWRVSYWSKYKQDTFQYDQNGNLLMEAYYQWSGSMRKGIPRGNNNPSGKTMYNYDNQGNQTMIAYYDWDNSVNEWIGCEKSKKEWKYDSRSRLVEEIQFDWNTDSLKWENWIKYQSSNNDVDDPIYTEQYSWNSELEEWELIIRNYYYYQSSSTGKNSIPNPAILIFPNPTSGIINITGFTGPVEVKVYSNQGQLMKSFTNIENQIDVSDLKSGIYILELSAKDGKLVRKIVVEK